MNENPYDILGVSRDASLDEVKRAYRKKARENHPDLNPDDTSAADRMNKINEAYDRIVNPEKYAREDARKRSNEAGATGGYGGGYGSPTGGGYGGGGYGSPNGGGYRGGGYTEQQEGTGWSAGGGWDDIFGGFGGAGSQGQAARASATIHPEASVTDSNVIRRAIDDINAGNYSTAESTLREVPSTGRNARWYYLMALAQNGAGNTVQALDQIRRARQMDPDNSDYKNAERAFTQRASSYEQESERRGFSIGSIDPTMICCCVCIGITLCQMPLRMGMCY